AGPITGAVYSPDGKTLAAACDQTIRLWDMERREERGTLSGFMHPLLRLRFAPDGKTLAVACRCEKEVRLCNLGGQAILTGHTLEITDLAFAPEGRRLVTAAGGDNVGEVKLWDLDTRRELASLPKQAQPVRSVAFAIDGRTLAVAGGKVVALWD